MKGNRAYEALSMVHGTYKNKIEVNYYRLLPGPVLGSLPK